MARSATRTPTTAPLPDWVMPQLTQLVEAAPDGDGWLHEIKYDGYRMMARLEAGSLCPTPAVRDICRDWVSVGTTTRRPRFAAQVPVNDVSGNELRDPRQLRKALGLSER